jgi:DNA uptake protein ComE-like DNA-binding protein
MMSTLLTHFAYQARLESNLTRWRLNQDLLRWAARGAAHAAAARVAGHATEEYNGPSSDWWFGKDYKDVALGVAKVSFRRPATKNHPVYGLDDEESRLNVNIATAEQLMGFEGISSVVAEAIVRFRNDLKARQEAEAKDRRTANVSLQQTATPVSPSSFIDGPIQSLRQLLAVQGVTEQLLFTAHGDRPPLAEFLTTTSSGKVNVNSATATVLAAAGLTEGQVNSIVALRNRKPIKLVEELQAAVANPKAPGLWNRVEKIVAVRSSTFRLSLEARLPYSSSGYRLDTTVYCGRGRLVFVRWREYENETLSRT